MVKHISNNSEISWETKYTPVVVRVLLSIYPLIVGLELTPRALTSRQKGGELTHTTASLQPQSIRQYNPCCRALRRDRFPFTGYVDSPK